MTSKNKASIGVLALIYSLYFFSPTISAITPALAEISMAYPAIDAATIGYVVTITAVFQAVTAIPAGAAVGRVIKPRTLLIIAAALYVVSGCFPFFLSDGQGFAGFIVSRALLGVALGIVMPLSNSLVMMLYQDESRRAAVVGIGNVLLNVGTIATTLIGGYLCTVSWQTTFLVYASGLVMLVLALLFMGAPFKRAAEANKQEAQGADTGDVAIAAESQEKGKFPLSVVGYILLFVLVILATQPMVVYNAQYITGANMGTSVTVGYMITIFSVGGMLASFAFKRVLDVLGKWIIPTAFAIAFISALCGYVASEPAAGNLPLYAVGIFLAGVALLLITCYTPVIVSSLVSPDMVTAAMGGVSFAMAIGTFLTTPFAQLVALVTGSDGIRMFLLCAGVCALAIAVIAFAAIFVARMRKSTAESGASLS